MSHTVKINDVEIVNVAALKAAVKELNDKGVDCTLLENMVPKAYYDNQQGMSEKADFVLRSPKSKYDVAFYKTKNAKGTQVYEPRTDTYGGGVQQTYGNQHGPLGRLTQLYSVHAVSQQAARQGYRVSRKEQEDGSITLSLVGR